MKKRIGALESYLYPTPCVLVTCGQDKPNIITVAWCGVVCSKPPQIGISVRPARYSYALIKKEGVFGINIPTADMVKQVDLCGVVSGKTHDKFSLCGFTCYRGDITGVPLIKECPVNMECRVKESLDLGVHTLFIGEVVEVYTTEGISDTVDDLNPLAYIPVTGEYVGGFRVLGSYGFSKGRK